MSDIDDDELKELKALQEKKEHYQWEDDDVEYIKRKKLIMNAPQST